MSGYPLCYSRIERHLTLAEAFLSVPLHPAVVWAFQHNSDIALPWPGIIGDWREYSCTITISHEELKKLREAARRRIDEHQRGEDVCINR